MSNWNHRMCEVCWAQRHPEGRVPVRLMEPRPIEICCFCAGETQSGIFVRQDPKTLQCTHKPEAE